MDIQIKNKLVTHLKKEWEASQVYIQVANIFIQKGYKHLYRFYIEQAKEEQEHFFKLIDYMESQGVAPDTSLPQVQPFGEPTTNVIEYYLNYSLKQEKKLSKLINDIYSDCVAVKDFRTAKFLEWFIEEQDEEEQLFSDLLETYNQIEFNKVYEFERHIANLVKN